MGSTKDFILGLGESHIEFRGHCHDCGADVSIEIDVDGNEVVSSGAMWYIPHLEKVFAKCEKCYSDNPDLTNFQPCEVFSRVVGYMRPVSAWNKGKQAEWGMRKNFTV